jgi:CRP-like cAMP-binding protein
MMTVEQMFKILFDSVSAIIEMPDSDKQLCYEYFEPVTIPKKTLVEKAGKVPQYQYFVVSGIMRNFYLNDSGDEVTTDINNEPRFFTSYNHFVNRTISQENIQCVTECRLLRIKRDDVDILYQKSIILPRYTILLFEKIFEEERKRIQELTTLTAEQRYLKFVDEQKNIIRNVPLQYIASYLGIKPETISRIRRKLLS